MAEARERDSDRRTERSLELYRDLVVDVDTANAFHRLSVLLRHTKDAQTHTIGLDGQAEEIDLWQGWPRTGIGGR